jgi:tRNA U38,U39,U40 pseudouridine synthase TruA
MNARPLESKVNWSRSSRTDAGVHALRLVIAAKLLVDEEDIDVHGHSAALVAEINCELPDDIRCFGAIRVPRSFDAKSACSWREYEYLLPTHLVCRTEETVASVGSGALANRLETALRHFEGCHSFHNFTRVKESDFAWKSPAKLEGKGHKNGKGRGKKRKASEVELEAEATSLQEDGGPATFEDVSAALGESLPAVPEDAVDDQKQAASPSKTSTTNASGQDSTCNSGPGRQPEPTWVEVCACNPETGAWKERSAEVMKHTQSTIHMAKVEPTHGGELLRVRLRGQFFLYNQIRLMIGTAVAVSIGTLSEEILRTGLLLRVEMHMPLAPAVGLLLRTAGFTEMDRRAGFCAMDRQQAHDAMMPPEGIVLVSEHFAELARDFEGKVETEVQRQWHEAGELEAWTAKLACVRGPSEQTLASLRIMASEAAAKEADFRTSQAEADRKRREKYLATGSGGFLGAMPRRFAAELMVRFRILPGRRLTNIQWAVAAHLRNFQKEPSAKPACLSKTWPPELDDLLQYVAQVGAEALAEEGARGI